MSCPIKLFLKKKPVRNTPVIPAGENTPLEIDKATRLVVNMEECMERLSARQRAIFKMHKQQERQAEIAKKIEITQAHVADQFHEACMHKDQPVPSAKGLGTKRSGPD